MLQTSIRASRALHRLYIGSVSASPTACPLCGYGRAGTQNDHLAVRAGTRNDRFSEVIILSTGRPIPAQWTCSQRRRDRGVPIEQYSGLGAVQRELGYVADFDEGVAALGAEVDKVPFEVERRRLRHTITMSGHDYIGHNYIGHNYIGHNYIGHNYTEHNYIRP